MQGHGVRGVTRRDFLKMMGLAWVAAQLPGCRPTQTPAAAAERAELVYQDFNTAGFPSMARQSLGQFQAQHPNITVFYIPDPVNLIDQMPIDMQAGTAPDVFQGCCTHLPQWAQRGFTLDLRPYVARDLDQDTLADWDPAQYQALFTPDGTQFGLPKYHGALALYYNKDLFDELGVSYPDASWDHDRYARAMKALTIDRDGNGNTDVWGSMMEVYWDRVQVHVNGFGGHFVDPANPRRCLMGEPEALAAVEWLRARIWDDRVMATLPRVGGLLPADAFIHQKVAMIEDGSWSLKKIISQAPFRVGLVPLPAGPARRVTLATTDAFAIYEGTRHPDAAWELLKFLISKEYGRSMAKAALLQPARASILNDWIGYVSAEYPEQAADLDLDAFADGQLKGYSVVAEIFPNMAGAQKFAQDAWDRILTLGQAPVSILTETRRQIEAAQG